MRGGPLSLIGIVIVAASAGCATSYLRVESNPEGADVLVGRSGSVPTKIGQTPLTISKESSPELFNENVHIVLSKEGYQRETLFLPKAAVDGVGNWKVELKQPGNLGELKDQEQALNFVAQTVAEAQQKFFRKDYAGAQRMLEELTGKYPNLAVAHDLLGNVFYVQKDSARALEAYRRSYAAKPNNPDTARMIEKLSQIQAGRRTAGGP